MAFFKYHQNNSGGETIITNKLKNIVWIEANNAKQANEKAQAIGIYFDGCSQGLDCSCCGDRWNEVEDYDKAKFPIKYSKTEIFKDIKEYTKYLLKEYKWISIIYYQNGTVEIIDKII